MKSIKTTVLLVAMLCGHFSPLTAQEITLLFAGDAMQHQSQINNALRGGRYDYSSYFQYVSKEIAAADVAIVNLEVTLAGTPYAGYPQFSAPDEYAFALKEAGFDVFLNANNHIVDRANSGLLRTLAVLDSMQVAHTGVFRDEAEKEQTYPLLIEKEGIRLALLNYTYGTNGNTAKAPVWVNYIDDDRIRDDIRKAKAQKPDIIIANMHWGEEYKLIQNKEQERLANILVAEGVDLIIGTHPHVIQPSKAIVDSNGNITNIVAYSLGNFISAQVAPNTDGGQLLKIKLKKAWNKTTIQSAEYALVYRHKAKVGDKTNFTVLPISSAEKTGTTPPTIKLDAESYRKMMVFAKNARAVFDLHNEQVAEYKVAE
ncbi:capsule biosynthesis protein capA [Candidatus Symbiothrix dinenymphae]|nr:capsule biosynthesis protein capA [Candidatus Symbiothrix dinenymphae]